MSETGGETPAARVPVAARAIIAQMFSTPVARIPCPYAEEFSGPLTEVILGRTESSYKRFGYKSETSGEMSRWGEPVVDDLTRWVVRMARQVVETIVRKPLGEAFADSLRRENGDGERKERDAGDSRPVGVVVSRSWASVYRKGDRHEAHSHPNTALTAIYYVTAPGPCELDLLDPRPNVDYFDPGISLAGDRHRVRLSCPPGELVLFPGWVRHAVPEFQDDSVRISASWNLNYAVEG
jgi:hypothetical protein